jgi:hypothetical protein
MRAAKLGGAALVLPLAGLSFRKRENVTVSSRNL